MVKVYRYLFYRFYQLERSLFDPSPEVPAFFLMLFAQITTIALLLFVAEWISGLRLVPDISKPRSWAITGVLGLPQYFALLHRGKYRRIVDQFTGESSRKRTLGSIAVALYVVLSLVFAIALGTHLPR
jgi:hypothetical protein